MKTGFSLCGKLHRENPVLALHWPCTGLQCAQSVDGTFQDLTMRFAYSWTSRPQNGYSDIHTWLETQKPTDFYFLVCCLLSRSAMCSLISRRYRRSAVTCVRRQYPVLEWGSNSSRVGLGLVNQSWIVISEIIAINAWQIQTHPSGNRHSISLTLETNKQTSSWLLVALRSQNMDKIQFRVRTFWKLTHLDMVSY